MAAAISLKGKNPFLLVGQIMDSGKKDSSSIILLSF